jgi:SAM-dependent methyltransferase
MMPQDKIQHPRLRFVDHGESFGRNVFDETISSLRVQTILDIGCGHGNDLDIARKYHPQAQMHGIDYKLWNAAALESKGIRPVSCNIEKEPLPFANESFDLIIANQVLEHTKEVFWINHEIFRTLKVGGHLWLGVPNVLSLHNRLLGLLGVHPTTCQLNSAHVRAFSKKDTIRFYASKASEVCEVVGFRGANFYPFPRQIARPLANTFPSLAVAIFFLIRKKSTYSRQFIDNVEDAYETNYFVGV